MPSTAAEAVRNAHLWFEVNSGWAPPDDLTLAEWLAYVDWEGFDSALYANIGVVAVLIADDLLLPEVAANLLQARDAAVFETQRPALATAALLFIERHIALFPR